MLVAVRAAVSAFRREEESQVHHSSKRRRERSDQVCPFFFMELHVKEVIW